MTQEDFAAFPSEKFPWGATATENHYESWHPSREEALKVAHRRALQDKETVRVVFYAATVVLTTETMLEVTP